MFEIPRNDLRFSEEQEAKLLALRGTLNASIRDGGAHGDDDVTLALDEEEALLAKDGC